MKKNITSIIFAILLVNFSFSQTRYLDPVFYVDTTNNIEYAINFSVLLNDTIPIPTGIEIPIDVDPATGSPIYFTMPSLEFDLFEPAGDTVSERPLIIYLHTGTFVPIIRNGNATGSRTYDYATQAMCFQFATRGYVVANTEYRLGWNPFLPTEAERGASLMKAAYRGIQDTKAAIRFFRKSYEEGNPYGIDTSRIIICGQGTGGWIATSLNSLDKLSELQLPKFLDPVTAIPLIDTSVLGDWFGYGGNPNLNMENHKGYSSDHHMILNMGGAIGDLSWLEAGDKPIAAVHGNLDAFARFTTGNVSTQGVNIVSDISGSHDVVKKANELGNNDILNDCNNYDEYTIAANNASNSLIGTTDFSGNVINEAVDNLFPFVTGNPGEGEPWEYFDSLTTIALALAQGLPASLGTDAYLNSLLSNPDMSFDKANAYIDSTLGFFCPRIVNALLLPGNNSGLVSYSTDTKAACDSYTWIDGNTYYSSNNTATYTLTNIEGCDSIVSLDLTINNSDSSYDYQSICVGESLTWIDGNSYSYNLDGIYGSYIFENTQGCDSTVYLNVSLLNQEESLEFTTTQTAGPTPHTVYFDNQTENLSDYNFTWAFGDGTVVEDNGSFVTHIYQAAGTWDVSLIAENIYTGCIDTLTQNGYIFTVGGSNCTHNATINESGPITACLSDSISLSCNTSAEFTYQWQLNGFPISGANSATHYPTESGNYIVVISEDNCPVYSSAIEVNFTSFDAPTISASGEIVPCIGGEMTLSVPSDYEAYLWSNGLEGNIITVSSSGNYYVTVTNSEGCEETSSVYVINASSVATQEICIITVDSTSQHNLIVWEKEITEGIDSYLIYREMGTNNYEQIGSVPYDSLSQFIDTSITVNPNVTSYRYRVSILDTCGTETNLSEYHETMHLSINQGISGEINLIWDEYEGVPINYYYILRDSTFFNDQWELIDSVSSNNFIYTDYNVPTFGASYVIEVVPPNGCTATRSVDYSSTRSNRTTYSVGVAPTAEFTASLTIIDQGDAISFFDQSINSPTSWSWVFEGGSPATSILENPTGIVYNNTGVYDVTLIVSNDFGTDTIVKTDFITVNNNTGAPSCAFLASSTQIAVGTAINFLDQTQNNPTNWTWVFEGGNPSFSTEQSPSGIVYNNMGMYDVTLIANNANGSDTLIKTDYINVSANTGFGNSSDTKVNIYPNPTDLKVRIDIDNYSGEINTKVFDLIGNLILSTDYKVVNLENYSSGIYLFKISYADRVEQFKVIKD